MLANQIYEIFKNSDLKEIINILETNGAKVRLVGGIVRDFYLNKKLNLISDIDLVTNFDPKKVLGIFEKNNISAFLLNENYGTVCIKLSKHQYEITSLRSDIKNYGRHAKIQIHDDWDLDARRRDFTFNAIYLDIRGNKFDPFDGIKDLRKKLEQAISATDGFGRDARSIMNTLGNIKNPEQVTDSLKENPEKIKVLK